MTEYTAQEAEGERAGKKGGPKIRKAVWRGYGKDTVCPVCRQPVLNGDPIYNGLFAGPVHEWCAWGLKQAAEKERLEGKRDGEAAG
jgi:hypothetical protein